MSNYKIETGIPIPPKPRVGKPTKYPWSEMLVGDSFFVEAKLSSMRAVIYHTNKRLKPKTFVSHSYEKGVRVWRIK